MNTTTTTNILFDQVNLSSLKSIVDIYQKKRSDNDSDDQNRSPFTNHFGLPLSTASFENLVIGYAFVKFNNDGETEINSYWKKEFYSIEAEHDLKFHAKKTFEAIFNDPKTRSIKIQNATDKLSNWLNNCN